MKLDPQEISRALSWADSTVTMDPDDRRLTNIAVISKAVAYSIPLPGQAVESIRQYYVANCEEIVNIVLSDLNECRVFDVRRAREFVFQIYRARYAVAFDPRNTELHKIVDQLVASDLSKSIEPAWRGIFERISANGSEALSNASNNLYRVIVGQLNQESGE